MFRCLLQEPIRLKANSSYRQWCEHMYLCGFVALYVRMFVAGANKVEGTMSLMRRDQ